MKKSTLKILDNLILRYPNLNVSYDDILQATNILIKTFNDNKKLLICGNGGSASDSLHIVGELMKSFVLKRSLNSEIKSKLSIISDNSEYFINNLQMPLPAIALVNETALITAYSNDVNPDLVFAQQVLGYGSSGDCLLAISTSGNSANVIYAVKVAKALGLSVIGLTGNNCNSKLNTISDVCIKVPESETFKIQELHLPIYHAICLMLEEEFFGDSEA